MAWVATAIGGSAVLGYLGTQSAAKSQANSANQANQTQWNMFQQQQENNAPWLESGKNALSTLNSAMGPGGSLSKNFSMSDFTNDPGYQFRLQQGQQALDRSAASKGMNLSGAQLKASQNYGQNMGTQDYQQTLQNWNNQQNTQFNRLASMAGVGQQAASADNAAGQNAANNVAQNQIGAGNAQAASTMAGINGITGAANQFVNYSNNQNMWNALSGNQNTFSDPNAGTYSSFSNPYGYGN